MAQQTISLGTTANDGTGDTLRDAGGKINANFSELYASLGGSGYTDEQVRDVIAAALVAGTGITITPDDAANTITIAASGGASSVTFIRLDADFTLTSATTAQKIFDTTANGRLTLTTGVYRFRAVLMVTGMSATSGNADFNLLGAGSATLAGQIAQVVGREASANAAGGTVTGSMSLAQNNLGADNLTAATTTTMQLAIDGMFKCTVAGTIVPSLALTTAAAAVVKAGSFMEVTRIAELGTNSAGAWS